MSRISRALILGGVLALALPGISRAEDRVGWHSPMRPQLELSSKLTEQLDIRFGINQLSQDHQTSNSDYAMPLDDASGLGASALIDWRPPTNSGLRLTGGALYGSLGWSSLDDRWLTGSRYTSYGTVAGAGADGKPGAANPLTPYLGFGWDNDFGAEGRFGLQLDLGVMFQSVPTRNSSGDSTDSTSVQQLREDTRLSETFESFRYTPMFSAGFRYRF